MKSEKKFPFDIRGAPAALPALSPVETKILSLLLAEPDLYGLQLVAKSDGYILRGTVYVTLDRMEKKGFVESRLEERPDGRDGPRRRLYRATGYGRTTLTAMQQAAQFMAEQVAPT